MLIRPAQARDDRTRPQCDLSQPQHLLRIRPITVQRQHQERARIHRRRRHMEQIFSFEMNSGRMAHVFSIINPRSPPIYKMKVACVKPIVEAEPTEAVFDKEVALSRVGGDAELLKEIAILFLDDYPKSLSDLRDAVEARDAKRVERTAHGLKGSVSNFGAAPAVNAALRLETMGRAQKLVEVEQVLRTLELALAALRPELESL